MDFEVEYTKNRTQMNRIKKEDKIFFIMCAANLVFFLFSAFLLIASGEKSYLISTVVYMTSSVGGVLSLYKRNTVLAVISSVGFFSEMMMIMLMAGFSLVTFLLFGVLIGGSVRNIMNVRSYQWLQQQDGFPYFEPKQKIYEMNKAQWNIKDPYTIEKERREKNSAGHMDDI